MSAYVPDKFHIDLMVDLAIRGPRDREGSYDRFGMAWFSKSAGHSLTMKEAMADSVGQMLVDEAVRSVKYRYPDDSDATLPGPLDCYWQEPYAFERPNYRPTAVEALKAVNSYQYQACEPKDWQDSEAYEFCLGLQHNLIRALPGYDDAPWEWTSREIAEKTAVPA